MIQLIRSHDVVTMDVDSPRPPVRCYGGLVRVDPRRVLYLRELTTVSEIEACELVFGGREYLQVNGTAAEVGERLSAEEPRLRNEVTAL